MSDHRPPSFDELVEPGDPDRARLLAAHELLVAAGAPPELPPSLEEAPPEPSGSVIAFPRRRYTAIAAVAVAATVLFGVGYAIGGRNSPRRAGADDRDEGPGRSDGLDRPAPGGRGRQLADEARGLGAAGAPAPARPTRSG